MNFSQKETAVVSESRNDRDSMHQLEELDDPGVVAPKWRGTETDKKDMSTLGRTQVLRVSVLLTNRSFNGRCDSN